MTELIFVVVTLVLVVGTAAVAVPCGWLIARVARRHWPTALRSAGPMVLMALAGPAASIACAFTVSFAAVLGGAAAGLAWVLFLFLLTIKSDAFTSELQIWLVRGWLLACFLMTGLGLVVGLAIGASQGIH